jgi:hypothetical protein
MIAFDLQCNNGHTFEGWFEDSQAYEQQQQKGLVTCPICNDTVISKLPSTFGIKGSPMSMTKTAQGLDQLEKMGRKLAEYVENTFDDVGCDFAKEALKIHYGAQEPRNIRGVSTDEEEKTLKKEGIQFFKFPTPPPPDTESGTES